jgi:SAM-dependent methyltransferase
VRKSDRELEVGALAHFEDPAYYASTYASRTDDVAYYRAVAHGRGSVVEHGVGNGRIALPLARDGVHVTGIDHAKPMLDDLRARLGEEPPPVRRRVKLVRGDLRTTRLARKAPLVLCPFNAALHLYTREDVEAWLARVSEQLEPGGELVFDVSMPLAKDLARDPNVPYRVAPFEHPTAGRVRYHERFDYDPVRQILFVSMFFEPTGNKGSGKGARRHAEPFMTPLAQRQFFPRELEALLHYNGFEVLELFGDFQRGPLTARSDVMVWHARPKRGTRRLARGSARLRANPAERLA